MNRREQHRIRLKSPEEIEILAEGGRILSTVLDEVTNAAVPGMTGKELDMQAEQQLRKFGAEPSFKAYQPGGSRTPFPATLCVSVNNMVVHGIPTKTPFKNGDVIGFDIGCKYRGLYTDMARTVIVGSASDELKRLVGITKSSLQAGIDAVCPGNTIGDIGAAIQHTIEDAGLFVVTDLVGHGVGYEVHEEPAVPNVGRRHKGTELQEGMVLALEPMVTIGDYAVTTASDGWTIITRDGGIAAHEEHTVAVVPEGARVLTVTE